MSSKYPIILVHGIAAKQLRILNAFGQIGEELKKEGIVSGGMIPKVECCVEAIREGVKNVVIMDGRVPHSILMELLTEEDTGTMVMPD